jgi:hypothetical protein
MTRIFSNGGSSDYVVNPFDRLAREASRLYLAAPYFTKFDRVVTAAQEGKIVQLLVGLNSITTPKALHAVSNIQNVSVRYFSTRHFHVKIYIFDDSALLGSSNLTDSGLLTNREAVICLDQPGDSSAVEAIRALFLDLWESAHVLTDEVLRKFKLAYDSAKRPGPDPDTEIENAVGRVQPRSADVTSWVESRERIFLKALQTQIYEQYRPAFREVTMILQGHGYRRAELKQAGPANETNRFLNWVRLTHAIGDDAWQSAPKREAEERQGLIATLGKEWATTDSPKIQMDYLAWLKTVERIFGTKAAIASASKEDISDGLLSLHAFAEQLRFTKGGLKALPIKFWEENPSLDRVRETLTYLIHGPGDFVERLHDVLYEAKFKLSLFGRFCALELYGTVKPEDCPPLNGRMAKALRYLGYDVVGA